MCGASVILYVPKFVARYIDILKEPKLHLWPSNNRTNRMLSYFRENWIHMMHYRGTEHCRESQYCVVSAGLSVLSIDTIVSL